MEEEYEGIKWGYMAAPRPTSIRDLMELLTDSGDWGWELIMQFTDEDGKKWLIFKHLSPEIDEDDESCSDCYFDDYRGPCK